MARALTCLLFAACAPQYLAPPDERREADRADVDVVLTFAADWTETASAPLFAGATVWVDYDLARLPQCRGWKYGYPAWGVGAGWRVNGGPAQSFPLVMHSAPVEPVFVVPEAGELELWFSSSDAFGCVAYDSNFGANYRFPVANAPGEPDWMGHARVAISRATCGGDPCEADLHPLEDGFRYDTWARQRAAVAEIVFQVWEPGITDWDNPDLWQQLDVRVHWRTSPDAAFRWDWVDFDQRVGNDARYALRLRDIDPLRGATVTDPADCPDTLTETPDGFSVETPVELYFTVNGHELRPADGGTFRGVFQDYRDLYAICL